MLFGHVSFHLKIISNLFAKNTVMPKYTIQCIEQSLVPEYRALWLRFLSMLSYLSIIKINLQYLVENLTKKSFNSR